MNHPIVQRELLSALRTRKALAMQVLPAVVFALLVLLRWPTDDQVALSGAQAQEVFRLFGYGLLATLLLLVPIYPATAIVSEKIQGTLTLLFHSELGPWSIYTGKLLGVLGFVFLPLVMSVPAAAACYAMGGIAWGDLVALYAVLALVTVQYAALGLLVSSRANSTDSALRITFGLALLMSVVSLGPYQFVHGKHWPMTVTAAETLRCVSPVPAVMEILGQRDAGAQGLVTSGGTPLRYALLAVILTGCFALATVRRLRPTVLDRPRPPGVMTQDRRLGGRWFRRMVFIVDPQRRRSAIGRWVNPVMVKEFRARRFGRSHWMLRLVAGCVLVSLGLTYAATSGTFAWGVETIGGIMVALQAALVVLVTPSLAAGLISSEHESGGWTLLRMTPLSAGRIVRGKLASVFWTLLLILVATLPGYAMMIYIMPVLAQQICYVLVCLLLTAVLSLLLSATVGSFFRRTAPATLAAYSLLVGLFGGTLLLWLGRDAPFAHATVEAALVSNPMAAALSVLEVPGFDQYRLVPASWWFVGVASVACLAVLSVQTWRLTRPQ